jgi:site-specific DNA-methyltransferase (adenine-specific)
MPEDLNLVNKLYYGDNLKWLREIPDEYVDLIYLDPPFNSKATYNVLFREKDGSDSPAQITAFEDTWHWDMAAAAAFKELQVGATKLSDVIEALRSFLGTNDMMAYLTMMAIRLVEMRRVLKKTGSIYLHCDPTASHYLKLLMDAVFGVKNFQNEIIWHYRRWTGESKRFQRMHDVILFYSKDTDEKYFEAPYVPYTDKSSKRKEHYHTRIKGDEVYITSVDPRGVRDNDVWLISVINPAAKERLGYPTQKPEELLERIIEASCPEGGIVLDPFAGCGTTIAVAERLHRRWIGIDITHVAIQLMEQRLKDTFGDQLAPYEITGHPTDLESARALAHSNRRQFELWALGLVGAHGDQDKKKGADHGIDGAIKFNDDQSGKSKKIIIQVKSGHVSVHQVRDLCHVVEREKAVMGVFVTLDPPTLPMKKEAAGFGFYTPEHYPDRTYPRMQLLTIDELLSGAEVKYPKTLAPQATFKKAAAKKKAPKGGDKSHPEAMFENGPLGNDQI